MASIAVLRNVFVRINTKQGGLGCMLLRVPFVGGASSLHTCTGLLAGQAHRFRTGQSHSGTEYGPLTDLPDWSFVDGRPAPIPEKAIKRSRFQEHIRSRVNRLMAEVDKAAAAKQHQDTTSLDNDAQDAVDMTESDNDDLKTM